MGIGYRFCRDNNIDYIFCKSCREFDMKNNGLEKES